MQLTITIFDEVGYPRAVKLALRQTSAELPVFLRLLMQTQILAKGTNFMVDTIGTPQQGPRPEFNTAFLRLYLNSEDLRRLEVRPELFPAIIKKYLPKEAIHEE